VPSSQPKQVSNFAPQNKAQGLIANTTFGDASQCKEYITEEEKSDGEEPLCIDSGDKKVLIVNDD